MNEEEYEGSVVLERLSEEGLLDDFMEAIDQDDILQAVSLMRKANIEEDIIEITVNQIRDSHFNH